MRGSIPELWIYSQEQCNKDVPVYTGQMAELLKADHLQL